MASTYEPIGTSTLGSPSSAVTFSSIPSTYTDLVLVFNGTTASSSSVGIRCNGQTTGYSTTYLYGNGSSAGSYRGTTAGQSYTGTDPASASGASNLTTIVFNFQNYGNTTTYKSILMRANRAAAGVGASIGMFNYTSAISSITVTADGVNFETGSTFTLYGIKAA